MTVSSSRRRTTLAALRSRAAAIVAAATVALVLLATVAARRASAVEGDIVLRCPTTALEPGQQFVIEMLIDADERVLGLYSVNLLYNPTEIVLLDVAGGDAPEFATAPTTDLGSFESGTTPVAAANLTSTSSPTGLVSVARITLETRAAPGVPFQFLVSPTGAADVLGDPINIVTGACAMVVAGDTPTPTATPTPTPIPVTCIGDCSGDGTVTVDEIITGVAIALGQREISECEPFDGNDDGEVDVTEIVSAVNASLLGCPRPLTPTPSPTVTPTPTATATPTVAPNQPPMIPDPGLYRAYPGEPIAFVIGAIDPEGGEVTYDAAALPAGAVLDPDAGVLTWTPTEDQAGPHYVPVTVTDAAQASAETLLRFQVALPTTCVDTTCDPASGCASSVAPRGRRCCYEGGEPERIAYVDAECPEGGVVFAGRNVEMGIGRLENCDWLRVLNFAQTGAAVRLNFETRCLRPEAGIRIRVRLVAPSRVVIDDDLMLTFFQGDNGYLERVTVPFTVLGGGPFFDLEFAEAQLSVIASDAFGNSVRTDKRVRLTFERLPDLDDPVSIAP